MFSIFQLRKMPEEIRPLALAEERIDTNESTAIQEIVIMSRKTMTMRGGVEMWRGGCRCGLSVAGPFVGRCLTSRTMLPFPHPAHRTGQAYFRHPALGESITMAPTGNCSSAW